MQTMFFSLVCTGAPPETEGRSSAEDQGPTRTQRLKAAVRPRSFGLPFVPMARPAAPERCKSWDLFIWLRLLARDVLQPLYMLAGSGAMVLKGRHNVWADTQRFGHCTLAASLISHVPQSGDLTTAFSASTILPLACQSHIPR